MKGGIGRKLITLAFDRYPCEFYLRFLSREIYINLCQIYTKIHIYTPELPPMAVQYHCHVSPSVSHDDATALPLMEVLVLSHDTDISNFFIGL